jgi:predicted DNA-binding protein (UPF0251 family)
MKETPLKLDLKGFTARQYAALIIKDELGLTHGQGGIKMGTSRDTFARLYRRAKLKKNAKSM